MAGSIELPSNLELPSTPIQELIKCSGTQIPERYIFNQHISSQDVTDVPYMECPIIDLQLLLDSSNHGKEELQKLRSALTTWGCFQLVNHGLASSLLDQLREVSKEFFELPMEEKQKYSRNVESFEGYGDDIACVEKPVNWNDRLHLKIYPIEHHNLKFWPENVTNFRETLHEYTTGARQVQEILLKSIGRSLHLDENSIYRHFGENGELFARINFFPPCQSPERVLGLKAHSDSSIITLLLPDNEVEGLQVLKDNQWFKVPLTADTFFINVGDLLEIMSNGIVKAAVHKVVIDKERQRISIAVPSYLRADKEVGPLKELINKDRPQLYKNVTRYQTIFLQHIAREERAITAVKIEL